MNLDQLIQQGGTLVYDPVLSSLTPDDFLSQYGEVIDRIAIVAKSEVGSTFFPSSTAPKDPRFGDIFSSFAQIATDIGIDVHAVLHGNVDAFFSRDPNFKMFRSGGEPIDNFVCANQETYWVYLAEIAAEIANKLPINGIILKDLLYPRETTCFCDNCRRSFATEFGMDRDFSLDQLKKRPEKFEKWQEIRVGALRNTISTVVNRVHQERKIEVVSEILVDPQTNYFEGAKNHFAQDLTALTQVSPHILMHFYPFTPLPSTEAEINDLMQHLSPVIEKLMATTTSIFVWKPNPQEFPLLQKIQQSIQASSIYFTEEQPRSYLDRRTLHLELQM